MNREERRAAERELRRQGGRKGRDASSAGTDPAAQVVQLPAPGYMDPGEALSRFREKTEEAIVEAADEDGGAFKSAVAIQHSDAYRYFHTDEILASLKADSAKIKNAARLKIEGDAVECRLGYRDKTDDHSLIVEVRLKLPRQKNRWYQGEVRAVAGRTKIISAACTSAECYGRQSGRTGYCVHVVRAVQELCAFLSKENPGDETDLAGTLFLSRFMNRYRNAAEAGAGEGADRAGKDGAAVQKTLDMEPVLTEEEGGLYLGFRIGEERLFKVKDIRAVLRGTLNGQDMQFGSKTVLYLSENRLTERGKRWFDLMRRYVEDSDRRQEAARRLSRWYEEEIKDKIPLFGAFLDLFWDRLGNGSAELTVKGYEGKEKFMIRRDQEPFRPALTLLPFYHAKKEFAGVELSGILPLLIPGQERDYCINYDDGTLRPVDRMALRILKDMSGEEGDGHDVRMKIGRKHLSEFWYKTLPVLRTICDITEISTEEVEEYLLPKPSFRFYFDAYGKDILFQANVSYGSEVFDLADMIREEETAGPALAGFRDREEEGNVLTLLEQYISGYDWKGRFFWTEGEDDIFRLLSAGVPRFMEIGEVHGTTAFRRIGIRKRFPVQTGVSLNGGLMNLSIKSFDLTQEELLLLFDAARLKKKYFRLKNGEFLDLGNSEAEETVEQLMELMDSLRVTPKEFVSGKMHIPAYRALYLNRMLEDMDEVETTRNAAFRHLVEDMRTAEEAEFEVPESLKGILRKYQAEGFRWLRTLDRCGFGGILADEMGLGKTLQVIAMLLAERLEGTDGTMLPSDEGSRQTDTAGNNSGNHSGPSIIVCPAALIYNWDAEFRKFAPSLDVRIIAGTQAERARRIADSRNADVLVTSYDLLKRDIAEYEGMQFRHAVIDEAQYIKNQGTAAAKSVKLISAKTRFALTGTPIENRLSELWSIFDFLMPGFLYGYETFRKIYELPVVKQQDETTAVRLRKLVGSFILRRRKKDMLKDLPDKLEENRIVGMEKAQRALYDAQIVHIQEVLKGQSDEDFNRNRIQILAELTRIRQICCDPALCIENYKGESAKLESCMTLLKSVSEGGHKALVFSQFVTMLDRIEERLAAEGIPYYKITGATEKSKRLSLVNSFNSDETPVFLISLKAGGTGLNLTGADIVIHYDPWWNVAVEDQATDRAHRIGQKKVVTVYKLVTKDTIEEKIVEMQEMKQKLAEDILDTESAASAAINRDELLSLLM